MEFIDEIERGELADELAATLAMESSHGVMGGEMGEEICQGLVMDGHAGKGGIRRILAGDEQVDGAAGFLENRVSGIKFPGVRDNAAEGLAGFPRDGHGHLVAFQGAAADE